MLLFFIVVLKKGALKMLQNIIIIAVVAIVIALAIKYLIKGGCNCRNKGKKSSSCRIDCHLKK
jgi:hypothetical protein